MPAKSNAGRRCSCILDYIVEHQRQHDNRAPTYREIGDHLDVPRDTIASDMRRLQDQGRVRNNGTNTRPTWVVVEPKPATV